MGKRPLYDKVWHGVYPATKLRLYIYHNMCIVDSEFLEVLIIVIIRGLSRNLEYLPSEYCNWSHAISYYYVQEEKGVGQLLQFYLTATESDKFLVLYVFIKLGLLQVSDNVDDIPMKVWITKLVILLILLALEYY